MINLSPAYEPVIIKGLTVHKDNPFLFDFIVDVGQDKMSGAPLKKEGEKLIKYFLASLAIPDKDRWVNLSPYEKNRMVPESLGQTDMGRDLLEQDYILKQITASLIYPEKQLGKTFWDKVYSKAQQTYGTTQIPVNTFNKVWIMADRAEVFEHNQTAFVVDQHLKVMLEEDYLALQKHMNNNSLPLEGRVREGGNDPHSIASQIIKQIILPELEKEVNTGKNFANLRQIFNSVILSTWYKKNLKEALLNQVYADQSKVKGINLNDPTVKQQIYEQYLKAYKKGVFNYIKEESFPPFDGDRLSAQVYGAKGTGPLGGVIIPRKYFSGGIPATAQNLKVITNPAMGSALMAGQHINGLVDLATLAATQQGADRAMAGAAKPRYLDAGPRDNPLVMAAEKLLPYLENPQTEIGLNSDNAKTTSMLIIGDLTGSQGEEELFKILLDESQLRLSKNIEGKPRLITQYVDMLGPALQDVAIKAATRLRGIINPAMTAGDTYTWEKYGFEFKGYKISVLLENHGLFLVRFTGKNEQGGPYIKTGYIHNEDFNVETFKIYAEGREIGNFKRSFNELANESIDLKNYEHWAHVPSGIIILAPKTNLMGSVDGYTPRAFPKREGTVWSREFPNASRLLRQAQPPTTVSFDRLDEQLTAFIEQKEDSAPIRIIQNENRKNIANLQKLVDVLSREDQLEEFATAIFSLEVDEQHKWIGFLAAVIGKCVERRFLILSQAFSLLTPIGANAAMTIDPNQLELNSSPSTVGRVTIYELMWMGSSPRKLAGTLKVELNFERQQTSVVWSGVGQKNIETTLPGLQDLTWQGAIEALKREHINAAMSSTLEDQVIDIIAPYTNEEREAITPRSRLKEDLGIRSLDIMVISMGLEELLGIPISREDDSVLEKMQTVEDVIEFVKKKKADAAMRQAVQAQVPKTRTGNAANDLGGIDLNTSNGMQWKVSKDGKGVEMNIDPAMIARVRREGMDSLSPVILRITPIASIWPLVGLPAPVK